ncbi:GATA zinc finger domain-containing protein 7 isoform X2 [Sitodiplosis mosellana]|uniref:GATA zinc finger domain-containing protein 7 isoform X2 n=1 Tax=Sitodiplosis mosellana TaxID=263140 RepID=UPI0024440858|nr:GATA zinc finger domain-containing protein 7 isoform X2 [Sitodiplosis mosellana]
MEYGDYTVIIVSVILSVTSITMLAACLCCRKKVQNNELLGLEGMVKIKNPDENLLNGNHSISIIGDSDVKISNNDITDSKRSLNVPHRSLPDIPISDPNQLDTNSDLYATVGDKVGDKPQGQSPASSAKKQISVSQHSSISQADDCSSPYARVRSPAHAYDKVRPAEHPYAQVKSIGDNSNRPSTSNTTTSANNLNAENNNPNDNDSLSRRSSHESLLDSVDGRQQVIPAASAIAGRVSASQELPYMTPPIVQPQHQYFSGDSQDSSKGYTSISVREPLANIIAQTKKQNAQIRRREISDSHYATVSDDSDEMYAAIEDPNNLVELYTSGSETYAQIQPQEPMVVSVEINPAPPLSINNTPAPSTLPSLISHPTSTQSNSLNATTPRNSVNEATVDMLKAAAHSRQASSSSCTSSVGNLGSPKPEKRQANSPLPPTPKGTHHYQSNSSLANPISLQSGRNSAASVIEVGHPGQRQVSRENLAENRNHLRPVHGSDDEPRKNRLSKDLEGMYAKVMKKNKLSTAPSENTSPVPIRKVLNEEPQPQPQQMQQQQQQQPQSQRQSLFLSDPDIAREINLPEALSKSIHTSPGKNSIKSAQLNDDNDYETIDKRRTRSSSSNYDSKNDPGYETIPADLPGGANKPNSNRNSSHAPTPPGIFLHKLSQHSLNTFPEAKTLFEDEPGYESLPDQSSNDPGYETVEQSHAKDTSKKNGSDYDPNYETLRPTTKADSVDHYAKVLNKKLENNDGYSSIKVKNTIISSEDDENLGYCTISEDRVASTSKNHDYASIRDTTKEHENVYSSITNDMEPDPSRNNSTIKTSSSLASTPSPIIMSPNMSVSMTSTISDTKTLTSPSSDGDSSSNTPICYNSIRSTDRSQLTVSVSNYESLTGSESDSNYESVRYLNAKDRENPYEQLYNESDIKYDTLKRDDTSSSVAGLYATSSKNAADFSKNSSLSSSSGSGLGGRSTSSLNNNSDAAS